MPLGKAGAAVPLGKAGAAVLTKAEAGKIVHATCRACLASVPLWRGFLDGRIQKSVTSKRTVHECIVTLIIFINSEITTSRHTSVIIIIMLQTVPRQ